MVYLITCALLLLHEPQAALRHVRVRRRQQLLDELRRHALLLVELGEPHQFPHVRLCGARAKNFSAQKGNIEALGQDRLSTM